MAKRHRMARHHSRRHFTKHADLTHRKNTLSRPVMRGGIRL